MHNYANKAMIVLCIWALFGKTPAAALDRKVPLADGHKAQGLACENCHGTPRTSTVRMEACLKCHGSYATVAARTKNLQPNPHDNHVIDLECSKCHQGHKPLTNYCLTCHAGMEFERQ